MNDRDREQWVMNDEGLYNWWIASHTKVSTFIRENRDAITQHINSVLNRRFK
jgi:hypothetical protein